MEVILEYRMFANVPLTVLENYMNTARKLDVMMRAEKPTFKNDYDYVDYALCVLQRSITLGVFPNDLEGTCDDLKKSPSRSEVLRIQGNILFKAGNFFLAHNLYTFSISYARTGSKELALAYGNRSAVLFEKQYYKECLEDIQRAFDNNYPREKRAKLLQRQAKAKELVPSQKKVPYHDSVPTIKHMNVGMPSASESIKMNKNKEFGRHIVANRIINPGEILLVEKPYSQSEGPEHLAINCSECLEVCYNVIPCEKCAGVLYCSKVCRRKAYVDYHRYECAILLHFGDDIINWNATRLTLKGIKEYDKEAVDLNVYRSDRYKEISELISDKGKIPDNVLVFRAVGAAKVFYALKKYTDVFSAFDVDDKENVFKTRLLSNSCIEHCNMINVKKRNIDHYIIYARALYSTLSIFNHACNENVAYSFYGSTVVLRAKKAIKKGEQCFINYGVNICTEDTETRQKYIQEFCHFTCKCQACIMNWPREEILGPEVSHLMIKLEIIYRAASCSDIDKDEKNILFHDSLRIIEKIELEAPILAYKYLRDIFAKLILEGNAHIPF